MFEIADIALFGHTIQQFMALAHFLLPCNMNKPSIVTSIDTFKEILGDDGGALFVDPMDDNQLARGNISILATDFKMREEING